MNRQYLAPFFNKPRVKNVDLFEKILKFLQSDMGFVHVRAGIVGSGYNAPGLSWGSCSTYDMCFDSQWNSVNYPQINEMIHFKVSIGLSARGPFVTSAGYELQPTPADSYKPPGPDKGMYQPSPMSVERAQKISLEVAKKFDLVYLDHEWLETLSIDENDLVDDAKYSLDYSEPTAFNILFSEFM